nr:MAG TPA: ECSIT protein-like protein [Caudoviricetes sp.]
MLPNNFFELSFKDQKEILYRLNSKELAELHEQTDKYIVANGNSDVLQWLLDKTFSLSYLRGLEEENPSLSLVEF